MNEIKLIPVKKISSPHRRRVLFETTLELLYDSISKEGMFNPIVVRPNPNKPGHYLIVQGRHRYYVKARMMEEAVIECRVFDMSDEEAKLATLSENTCRLHERRLSREISIAGWREVYEKNFPHLEEKGASGASRWSNSTKAEANARVIPDVLGPPAARDGVSEVKTVGDTSKTEEGPFTDEEWYLQKRDEIGPMLTEADLEDYDRQTC